MTHFIKKLSIIIFLSSSFFSHAQVKQFEWGIDVGENLIAGLGPGFYNSKLISTDTAGNIFIAEAFVGTSLTIGDTTYTMAWGNYAVTAKIDKNGHTEWMNLISSPTKNGIRPNGLIVDWKGDCYVVGEMLSTDLVFNDTTISGPVNGHGFVFKIKNDGSLDWGKLMNNGSLGGATGFFSISLHDESLRIGGDRSNFYVMLDAETGALLYQYPTYVLLDAHRITTDNQGNNYILDYSGHALPFAIGGLSYTPLPNALGNISSSSMIIKQDSLANTIWIKQFETESMSIFGMEVDNHGNLYILGGIRDSIRLDSNTTITSNTPNDLDFFVAKLDQNLQVIWYKTLGGIAPNTTVTLWRWRYHNFIELDLGGNIYLAFPTSSNKWIGNHQVLVPNNGLTSAVVKLNAKGDIAWVKSIEGYNNAPVGLSVSLNGTYLHGIVNDGSVIFSNKTITDSLSSPIGFVTKLRDGSGTNLIEGQVFHDDNSNGILDVSESGLPHILVNFNNEFYQSTNSSGYFSSYLFDGTYNVSPVVPKYWEYTTFADTTITFNNTWGSVFGLNFGVRKIDNVQDLEVYVASTAIRPGFDMTYYVSYRNVGTKIMSGQVELIIDDTLTYLSSTPTGNLVGSTISWNYDSLQIGETRVARVHCQMPVALGLLNTDLMATAKIEPISSDTTPLNNVFIHKQLITASYDPNDKQVSPNGIVDTNFVNDGTLLYTVRFQNTGNDTAFTIHVTDTLSAHLDVSSFQMIGASHAYDFELNGQAIMWTFNNILLPDNTTNEASSHGFIQYSIRPKAETQLNDTIANTAHIYFDFNPAIVTNTTINEVQIITSVGKLKEQQLETINIFPNPTKGRLTCEIDNYQSNETYRFRVFDMTGRQVHEERIFSNRQTMNFVDFPKGMYVFQVVNEDNTLKSIGKILIQ